MATLPCLSNPAINDNAADAADAYNLCVNYYITSDYEKMKKYAIIATKQGCIEASWLLHRYYTSWPGKGDFSFLKLHDLPGFKKMFNDLVNRTLFNDVCIPDCYKGVMCQIKFGAKIYKTVKRKQCILQKTNLWPIHYQKDNYELFQELVLLVESPLSTVLPKDVLLMIAGYLFENKKGDSGQN